MSLEHTDAAQKAALGRKVAVGRFLAIINAPAGSLRPDEEALCQPGGDDMEITVDSHERCTEPWRPLIDIVPPAPTRH